MWVADFWCRIVGFSNPDTFTTFHRWGLCLTIIGGLFTRGRIYPFLLIHDIYFVTPPTRHRLSSEGSFFFFFFPHIYFKLVHSYNVKQLTCIIFCSSGLQNIIYKLHNWKCSTSTIFTLVYKIHIQNRPKGLPVGTYCCVAFDC